MLADHSVRSEPLYESKYNCIICLERVKIPVSCIRCKNLICQNHLKKIDNRCPYCRLSPYRYVQDKFTEELVKLDKKKEQDFLISNKVFKCLVQGCNFEGKFHKMDLHRRREHRNETLREIIFPEERQNGKKRRAMQLLVKRLQEKEQKSQRAYHIAVILYSKCHKKVDVKKIYQMVLHTQMCGHKDCARVFAEETMCFIGNQDKGLSDCLQAQKYIMFYQ